MISGSARRRSRKQLRTASRPVCIAALKEILKFPERYRANLDWIERLSTGEIKALVAAHTPPGRPRRPRVDDKVRRRAKELLASSRTTWEGAKKLHKEFPHGFSLKRKGGPTANRIAVLQAFRYLANSPESPAVAPRTLAEINKRNREIWAPGPLTPTQRKRAANRS
jgi:hypothetical protein